MINKTVIKYKNTKELSHQSEIPLNFNIHHYKKIKNIMEKVKIYTMKILRVHKKVKNYLINSLNKQKNNKQNKIATILHKIKIFNRSKIKKLLSKINKLNKIHI